MQCIIHVGMPKTGSTSLQQFLAQNRLILEESGVFVPLFPDGISHRPFVSLINRASKIKKSDLIVHPNKSNPRTVTEIRAKAVVGVLDFRLKARRRNATATVLSAEQFFGLNRRRLRNLGGWLGLKGIAPLKFVAYIRDPLEWVTTKALEQLKTGHVGFPDDFFVPMERVRRFSTDVQELFGAEVEFRQYEAHFLEGGDVRKDFLKSFLPTIDDDRVQYSNLTPNYSISPEAALIVAEMRQRHFPSVPKKLVPEEVRRVVNASITIEREIGRPRPRLQENIISIVRISNAKAVNWLRTRYGLFHNSGETLAWEPEWDYLSAIRGLVADLNNKSVCDRIESLFVLDRNHLEFLRSRLATSIP